VPAVPDEVRYLYSRVGGMKAGRPMFLMTPHQVVTTVQECRDAVRRNPDNYAGRLSVFGDAERSLLLFDDNESSYFGLHLRPPLAPRGFVLNHDEADSAPTFRSLARMLDIMIDHRRGDGLDCIDAPKDYPALDASDAAEEDRIVSLHCTNT